VQDAASLREDINALKQLLIEQYARIAAKEEQLHTALEQLLERDVLIEKLKIELLRLKRMRFGRSSEQLDAKIAQLELTLEELEASKTQIAPATTAPVVEEQSERAKPVRKALPPQLPRENIVYAPACSCESCGGALERLGEDVREALEYVPSHGRLRFSVF
jgi:transposase